MKVFLIDFDNINCNDYLKELDVTDGDIVYLLYTIETGKLRLDVIEKLKNLRLIKTPAGDQSLDNHLMTLLGYLIGKNEKNASYYIVSNDSDYDPIINFWTKSEIDVSRIKKDELIPNTAKSSLVPQQQAQPKAPVSQPAQPQQKQGNAQAVQHNKQSSAQPTQQPKNQPQQQQNKQPAYTPYEQHIYNQVKQKYSDTDAKKVVEMIRKSDGTLLDVCNKMRSALGKNKGLECFAYLKPSLKKK